MQTFKGAEERIQKKLNGIIADLLVDFTSLSASAHNGSDEASSLFDVARARCGDRTLACGGDYTSFSAAHPNDRKTFPVEKRAAKAPKQYHAATRDLGHKFHESQRREMKPVETKLLKFGARNGPKTHAAVGFFSALLVSSPTAATASARPSRGWALPASWVSGKYRRRTPSPSAIRRSFASGVLRLLLSPV